MSSKNSTNNRQVITFAGGCFWCTEAIFKSLKGVKSVIPGYLGGITKNPTYEEVTTGTTSHVESIQINFDPAVISLKDILYIFFKTHDPTTLNRQGADVGSQYKSVIFYQTANQQKEANDLIKEIQRDYKDKIVTKVTKYTNFYPAESFHKNYYENHKEAPYCKLVIDPKLEKLRTNFKEFLH